MTGFLGVLFALVMQLATSWVSTDLSGNQVRAGHTFQPQRAIHKVTEMEHAVLYNELANRKLNLEQFRSLFYFVCAQARNYTIFGDNQNANIVNIVGTNVESGYLNINQITPPTLWKNTFSFNQNFIERFGNNIIAFGHVIEFHHFGGDVVVDGRRGTQIFALDTDRGSSTIPGISIECKPCFMFLNDLNPSPSGKFGSFGASSSMVGGDLSSFRVFLSEPEVPKKQYSDEETHVKGSFGSGRTCFAGYCLTKRDPGVLPFLLLGIVVSVCLNASVSSGINRTARYIHWIVGFMAFGCVILLLNLI